MKSKFKISLLDNGIHSFNKGLGKFILYEKGGKKDDFQLKEAIMFIHHGIELLLKQILVDYGGEHLVFKDIGTDTVKKIIKAKREKISIFNLDKPVHTASYLDVVQRIKAFVDSVEIEEALDTRLSELNTIRNNIEHYGIETEKELVENLLFNIKKPISKFFLDAGINLGQENINKWKELEKGLLIEVSRLRGGGRVKRAELKNGVAIIEYVENFEEYKKLQPQSSVTKEMYELYWSTGNAILKAINDGGVRLMRKLDALNKVKIKVPYKENVYIIDLDKNEVEKFLGFSFEEIRNDWDNTFSNKYVYTKEGQKEFFDKFGRIERKN